MNSGLPHQKLRLKILTNTNMNIICTVNRDWTVQQLYPYITNLYREVTSQQNNGNYYLELTTLKFQNYYVPRSQIVGEIFYDGDQIFGVFQTKTSGKKKVKRAESNKKVEDKQAENKKDEGKNNKDKKVEEKDSKSEEKDSKSEEKVSKRQKRRANKQKSLQNAQKPISQDQLSNETPSKPKQIQQNIQKAWNKEGNSTESKEDKRKNQKDKKQRKKEKKKDLQKEKEQHQSLIPTQKKKLKIDSDELMKRFRQNHEAHKPQQEHQKQNNNQHQDKNNENIMEEEDPVVDRGHENSGEKKNNAVSLEIKSEQSD